MPYSTVHLLKLAFAFELIALGLPAKLATELVENGWERLKLGCFQAAHDPYLGKDPVLIYAVFETDMLNALGLKSGLPIIHDEKSMRRSLGSQWKASAGQIVIDVTHLVTNLFKMSGDAGQLGTSLMYLDVRNWAPAVATDNPFADESWYRVGLYVNDGYPDT